MRQRIGAILFVTGMVLLIKPNFDLDQIMLSMNYWIVQYWPIGFVILGILLINPKKKRRTHSR